MATENSSEPSPSVVVDIAPDGDVILAVGLQERKLRVTSSVLKSASKFFKAMLGPHFSEGQDLGGSTAKEIALLEDNADALEVICNLIHFRNEAVPETLEPGKVLAVAVATDKLDCAVALKHVMALWLDPKITRGIVELGHLMAAAYVPRYSVTRALLALSRSR